MANIEVHDLGPSAIATSLAWFETRLAERRLSLDGKSELRRGLTALSDLSAKAAAGLSERLAPDEALRRVIRAQVRTR